LLLVIRGGAATLGGVMATKPSSPLGARRQAAGYTQERFAEELGVDRSTVGRWERGVQAPLPWQRPDIATALKITLDQLDNLLPEPSLRVKTAELRARPGPAVPLADGVPRRDFLVAGGAAAIDAALASSTRIRQVPLAFSAPPQGHWSKPIYDAAIDPADAARRATASLEMGTGASRALRQQIDNAIGDSLSSNYRALEQSLPSLIGSAESVALQPGGDEPAIQRVLSDLYAVVGWTFVKADYPAVAWIAAQRAIQAAERGDDILRVAAATRCLAEVHMRAGNYEEATRTALLASVYVEGPRQSSPRALSLRGAALLSAAAASARRGDSREALAILKAATFCAAELGKDHSDLATIFGPTNAAIHQVAIPIELGDARAAVRNIPNVHFEHMSGIFAERRTRFLIDVARSYVQVNEHGAAVDALVQAEAIAPDELRHHRLTRKLIPQLMTQESRNSGLRALAARCNLLT
jgi:transcriptional regulator with XRE-family HTH domain